MTTRQQLETPAEPVLRNLWWLDPTFMFALLGMGTTIVAWLSPEDFFVYHNTPKYVGMTHILLAALATAGFTLGSWYGRSFSPGEPAARLADRGWLWWWFLGAISLTALGYIVWTSLAIYNGLTVGVIERLLAGGDT